MSIPSAILVEEIKQKGFSEFPFENVFGEICIGYGHRILNNPDLLIPHDRDLAHAIKLYDGNGFYELNGDIITDYQKNLQEKVLSCGLKIDKAKAEELLIYDIANYFDELTRKSSAFRHLINVCGGDGCFLPKTQMSTYYLKLRKANQAVFEEGSPLNEHFDERLDESFDENLDGYLAENLTEHLAQNVDSQFTENLGEHSGEHFKRPPAYEKGARTVRFALSTSSQNGDFTSQNTLSAALSTSSNSSVNEKDMASANNINSIINANNASNCAHSINLINSVPNASNSPSVACANNPYKGEYTASRLVYNATNANGSSANHLDKVLESTQQESNNPKKSKKSKKKNWEFFTLPHSKFESALVRLDTVVHLVHLIGVKRVLDMKAVLACIRMDDFMSAAGYMLSNSWGENFGEVAVILSRRMRYGLMVSRVDEEIPEHLKQDFVDESLVEEVEKDDEDFGFYDQSPNESQDATEVAHS